MNYWVYILLCENGAYYTGYTNDIEARYQQHLIGKGAKYTRSFKPIKIAQSWEVPDKSTAMKMEAHLKKLTRKEKEEVILNHPPLS